MLITILLESKLKIKPDSVKYFEVSAPKSQ